MDEAAAGCASRFGVLRLDDVNGTARLAAALSVSGFVLNATAAGAWPLSLSALLWSAPMLIASRSLPLWLALPVSLVPAAAGRALAFHAGDDVTAALVIAALVPALLVDRFATTWAPRAAVLAWPCALVVTERVVASSSTAMLVPLPSLDAVLYPASDLGVAAGTFVAAVLCNGFAYVAGTLNRRFPDPYTQEEREAGVKLGAIGALIFAIALFTAAFARAHLASPPSPPTSPGDVVVVLCALGVVASLAAALVRRTARNKAAPAPRPA